MAATVREAIQELMAQTTATIDALLAASDRELAMPSSHACAQGQDVWTLITNDIDHEKIHTGQILEGRYEARIPASPMQRLIAEWLAERAPEVNYSARILWQELRSQHRFAGSYVIVRRAVAPLRMAASVAALTQRRFETGPGEQAQCDWGQITVPLGQRAYRDPHLRDDAGLQPARLRAGLPA